MKYIPDHSIDLIATDLPYGTTACQWDSVIDLDLMWQQVKRLLKSGGAFVTTAAQPFTSALIMSNPKQFKAELIWKKDRATGHLNANRYPLKQHENIILFCEGQPVYTPQKPQANPTR